MRILLLGRDEDVVFGDDGVVVAVDLVAVVVDDWGVPADDGPMLASVVDKLSTRSVLFCMQSSQAPSMLLPLCRLRGPKGQRADPGGQRGRAS